MQRVRALGGRIRLPQWRRLAELGREHAPEYPLHLTTRQAVELHGLRPEQLAPVHEALHNVGLTTERAGGDSLRNIVCCPGSGLCSTGVDMLPVAAAIAAACEAQPHIHALPRKFKISLSACERSCGRPWIQDLGFIRGPDRTFRAVVAGSLGARPGTGIEFPRRLKLDEVIPFTLAALRLFNAEGDRKVRARARLRHVRERLGDGAFMARLDSAFQEEMRRGGAPVPPQPLSPDGRSVRVHLRPPLGDLAPDAALALAEAAEVAEAQLRIGLDHDLLLYGFRSVALPESAAALTEGPVVVSCPGLTWCARGIADSRAAAGRIRDAFRGRSDFQARLSACPNGCAHSAVADIGLVGCVKTRGDARVECFRLLAGGGSGVNPALAHELHRAIPADRVSEAVRWLLDEHAKACRAEPQGFAAFVARESTRLSQGLTAAFGP